jgi:hypothetical protein
MIHNYLTDNVVQKVVLYNIIGQTIHLEYRKSITAKYWIAYQKISSGVYAVKLQTAKEIC